MSAPFDLGIFGGGQLGRMTIQAAQRMGLRCLSYDPSPEAPAGQIAPLVNGPFDNPELMAQVFSQCARVTIENEFIPASALKKAIQLAGRTPDCLVPGLDAIATIQDKLLQRQKLIAAGVPSPEAVPLNGDGTLAISKIGFPMVLKSRFGGYDGKGTRFVEDSDEFDLYRNLWQSGGGWLAEQKVEFKRELAVMVVAAPNGISVYPTMETRQVNHVCDTVSPVDADGSAVAIAAIRAIGSIGLFGVELFETQSGEILVNEIAPRPHNSGHYTLDWGGASQFEQHVRIALGLPPAPIDGYPTSMANLLGQETQIDYRAGLGAALIKDPGCFVHWYGKSNRLGRKVGHINASGLDSLNRVIEARNTFYSAWAPKDSTQDS